MNRFRKVVELFLAVALFRVTYRQMSAVLVLLAVMMPISVPVPVWAYDLALPPVPDTAFGTMGSGRSRVPDIFGHIGEGFLNLLEDTRKGSDRKSRVRPESERDRTESGGANSFKDAPSTENNESAYTSEEFNVNHDPSNVDAVAETGTVKAKPTTLGRMFMLNQLPEGEHASVFTPENNLGAPPGQTEMDSANRAATLKIKHRPGSANFSFGVPLAFLDGRGIDAGVSMTYNSRTWNKSCTQYDQQNWPNCVSGYEHFTYDVEQSWIAPGFSTGFGYLESSAQVRNVIYEDEPGENNWHTEITPIGISGPDGTRHQMQCKTWTTIPGAYSQQRCTAYTSADGTRMDLAAKNYVTNPGNQPTPNTSNYSGATWVTTFPGGTKIWYSGGFGSGTARRHYPFKMRDRNGNIIRIEYNADQSGRIDRIIDTLNRQIKFYYELNGGNPDKLIAISIPGMNTNEEIQTVRFYYEDMALNSAGKFTGQITAPANIRVLRWVYMPSTKTAYKYDYHSNYGMIKKIERRVGVGVSDPSSTTTTGTITDEGVWAATTEYNFPAGSSALSDAPKYSKRTDDWQGRPVGTPVGETLYEVNDQTNTTTITVKDEGFDVITRTVSDLSGMIEETYVEKLVGDVSTQMVKNEYTWSAARNLTKLETTNEALLKKKTEFDYDQYNNQEEIREYDYNPTSGDPTLLRTTEMTYETGAGWINANLTALVKSVKTIVGGVTVSKTLYEYDHNGSDSTLTRRGAMNGAGTAGTHDAFFNPDVPSACIIACPLTPEATCDNPAPDCDTPTYTYGYSSESAYRGNVTKISRMLDVNATAPDDNRDDVTEMEYDVLGNVVSATLSCCSLRTYSYDTTSFAYQTSQTSGSAPTQLTTSATYNMNTGLMRTSTDENGQETEYQYEPDTLRPKKTIFPNDGYVENFYSDTEPGAVLLPGYVRQKTTLETSKFVESYSYFDARGLGIRSATQTADGWSISAVEFDALGRAVKSYNPFYASVPNGAVPAGTKFTEVTGIDALGRTTGVKLQDDTAVSTHFSLNSEVPANFNKTFVTVTDQAGKKRRQVFDSQGRLVRVDEPDASGSLGAVDAVLPNQQTSYQYDGNDNLSKVIQSDGTNVQERKFKYDALSRLTHEKQVEATPTLDDSGVHGASDPNKWTKYLKYTPKGLLDYARDARNVKTDLSYDGLNRVESITYTGESGFQTPNVTYTYSQARSGFYNNGALTRVETAATATNPVTSAEFDYDLMGRLVKHRQWIGAEQYDMEYGYNLAGQLTSQKYPSGKIVTNSYDANGRLSGVADAQRTYLSGLQYLGKGNSLSQMTLGNGTTETFTLNDRFQMEIQELKKGSDVLQKFVYGYGQVDATGVLQTTQNNGQLGTIESYIGSGKQATQKFKYDHIGRLKESAEYRGDNGNLTYKQVFDFDRFGNLYRKAANNPTTGQQNPLPYTPIEEATTPGTGDIDKATNQFRTGTVYDAAGNVTTDTKFRQMGFAYDANGRQVKATSSYAPDAWTVYDAAGNRVATKVNDIWRYMVYDAMGKLVAEYGEKSDGLGGIKYVQQDWQGSVRTVTNSNGFVVARTDHQAFGGSVGYGVGQRSIDQGYDRDASTRQGYGLTERDEATGQDHTWFRKNENLAGRWTSPDPYNGSMNLGDPQSFNKYSYVQNDPANYVDPSGLLMVEYTCYDVNTYWSRGPSDGGEVGVASTTRCHFRVLPDEGGGFEAGGSSSPPFLERVNKNALDACLRMLYGLKADPFGTSVKLSRSGELSTTAEETTYEANFSVLEPGAKPVAELKVTLVGRPRGKGEITLSLAKRDKEGDLDAMLYGLGLALTDPTMDVGNYEYGAGFKVKRPRTPSALQDCYRRYAPKS